MSRVLLADDHDLVRDTLAAYLRSEGGFDVAVAGRFDDALAMVRAQDGFDLVLLDGAWSLYLPVLRILESRLAPGALVIAENAVDESGDYLTYVRDPGSGYRSLPLPFEPGRGNEMSVYVA